MWSTDWGVISKKESNKSAFRNSLNYVEVLQEEEEEEEWRALDSF